MANVLALITARSGSKGVPNKNIRLLGGHPLLAWSIKALQKSTLIDRIIVSTDSREYADIAINLGAEAPFLRPDDISGDASTDYECISHALEWLDSNNYLPNYIAHIRPTTPFRDPALIDLAIDTFKNSPKHVTSMRSAHLMSESAYKAFEINNDGYFQVLGGGNIGLDVANNARQSYPKTYQPNGYIDVLSSSFIRQSNLIHGGYVLPFITPCTLEVDTEADFSMLEYQLKECKILAERVFG
jgi:N-acylneuraminate cytidylyltransferase